MSRYFSNVSLKLGILGFLILVVNSLALFLVDYVLFLRQIDWKYSVSIPLLVGLVPVMFFLIFCLLNRDGKPFLVKLAKCKYAKYIPFIFYFDRNPKAGPRVKLKDFFDPEGNERARKLEQLPPIQQLRAGDILLRRHERYLDGIVFSENSYFTHAGLVCNRVENGPLEVLHANVEKGVHIEQISEFCKCDDIAVLRLFFGESAREKEMFTAIMEQDEEISDVDMVKFREKSAFESLQKMVKPGAGGQLSRGNNQAGEYERTVVDRAYLLEGTPYDTDFEFDKFDKLSCIEFVWYCFKSLFPLHRIRVEDFEFFKIFKLAVIVPDVFIHSDFFNVVYTTVPNVNEETPLVNYVKKPRMQFWYFIFGIFVWELVISFFVYLKVN